MKLLRHVSLFVLFLLIAGTAEAVTEISLYQRGYVEGGAGAATVLTDAAVAAFQQKNPQIKIRVVGVPWGEHGDLKLRTALLARGRIDLFRLAHDQLPGFIPREGRLLSPAGPHLDDADRRDFGATLDSVTLGGEIYAWPMFATAISMIANEELMRRAGVEPLSDRPWTWSEWREALQRVAQLTDASGRPIYGFNAASQQPLFEWSPLLMTHCGPIFSPDAETLLSPALPAALERVRELIRAGFAAPGFGGDDDTAAQQSFLDGRVAFLISSPGFLRRLQNSDLEFRVLPIPVGDWGRPITTGAVGCFAVVDSGDGERIAAAHALARYLTSVEIAEDVPGWYLAPPARASVTAFYSQPPYDALRDILPTAQYSVPALGAGFLDRIVIPTLIATVIGGGDAEAALAEIRAAARRLSLD